MIFGGFPSSLELEMIPSFRGVLGAMVATTDFWNALVTYGSFDEYHFFVPPSLLPKMQQAKENLLCLTPNAAKIKLIHLPRLPQFLQKVDYSAFHNPSGPFLGYLLYLRNQFTTQKFPLRN